MSYVNRVADEHFHAAAIPLEHVEEARRRFAAGAGAGAGAAGGAAGGESGRGDFDDRYRRNSMYWLGFSLVAMVGYALSGELASYIEDGGFDEDEDDEDEGAYDEDGFDE